VHPGRSIAARPHDSKWHKDAMGRAAMKSHRSADY
jgi:hypothetical protein